MAHIVWIVDAILIIILLVLVLFLCFSKPRSSVAKIRPLVPGDEDYWFDPILISNNEENARKFISDTQQKEKSTLYYIILDENGERYYLSQFDDPFNYGATNYIFAKDGRFIRKFYFMTEEDANKYIKENDIKDGSYVVGHIYTKHFCGRIRVRDISIKEFYSRENHR